MPGRVGDVGDGSSGSQRKDRVLGATSRGRPQQGCATGVSFEEGAMVSVIDEMNGRRELLVNKRGRHQMLFIR